MIHWGTEEDRPDIVNTASGNITVTNALANTIQVKVSNATNGKDYFYTISPGENEKWERSGRETVYFTPRGDGPVAMYCGIDGKKMSFQQSQV